MKKTIEQRVMREVRRIYYLRLVGHPTAVKCYGVVLATVVLAMYVSIPNVLANTPADFLRGVQYLAHALMGTELIVQALCLSVVVFLGMVVQDFTKHLIWIRHSLPRMS